MTSPLSGDAAAGDQVYQSDDDDPRVRYVAGILYTELRAAECRYQRYVAIAAEIVDVLDNFPVTE